MRMVAKNVNCEHGGPGASEPRTTSNNNSAKVRCVRGVGRKNLLSIFWCLRDAEFTSSTVMGESGFGQNAPGQGAGATGGTTGGPASWLPHTRRGVQYGYGGGYGGSGGGGDQDWQLARAAPHNSS